MIHYFSVILHLNMSSKSDEKKFLQLRNKILRNILKIEKLIENYERETDIDQKKVGFDFIIETNISIKSVSFFQRSLEINF